MVDLMLQDARVPAACVTLEWLAETIERLHPNPSCTGHDCSIAIHAEAAFEVVGQLALVDDQGRVHQYLRLNWHPLLLAQKLLWRHTTRGGMQDLRAGLLDPQARRPPLSN
jgi:hypothetical protein